MSGYKLGWHVELIYSDKREMLMVRDDSGPYRMARFPSKVAAKECQRVLSKLITASHFEGSTLIREEY